MTLVGLAPAQFAARWPHQLSGGQRQRVAFARALAAGARTLLLDEPFGALDAITRGDLQAMFLDLRRASGMSALLVTHDLHEAALVADRIAVLHQGRLAASGSAGRARRVSGHAVRRRPADPGAAAAGPDLMRRVAAVVALVCGLLLPELRAQAPAGGPAERGEPSRRRRFEAVRRVVSAGRALRPDARGARPGGDAAVRARRHRDRVPGVADRRHRRLPRVHRQRAAGDPQGAARTQSRRRERHRVARVRPPLRRAVAAAAGVREHLRDVGAHRDGDAARLAHAERLRPGEQGHARRLHGRLHRPARWPARAAAGVRTRAQDR